MGKKQERGKNEQDVKEEIKKTLHKGSQKLIWRNKLFAESLRRIVMSISKC